MSLANPETSAALSLLNASAVRERAHRMLAIGLDDRLPNFRIHLDRMDGAVDLVLETTRKAYPSFDVPFHSRWRHFVTNGDDRWADIADRTGWPDRAARARAEFDLAIVSVFLDAGAGPSWRYHDPKTGSAIGRSEGLGLASLAHVRRRRILGRSAPALARRCRQCSRISPLPISSAACRSRSDNPTGRSRRPRRPAAPPGHAGGLEAGHVRQPRHAAARRPVRSTGDAADGGSFPRHDSVRTAAAPRADLAVAADAGRHRARRLLEASGADRRRCHQRLVPLHKLSQWLAYSLIEPLQARRHRRHRYRWPHRPGRISQRRPVRRHRRADVSRSGSMLSESTRSRRRSSWNGAR